MSAMNAHYRIPCLLCCVMMVALSASCRHNAEGEVIAQAYHNYLCRSDIEGLVGEGVSPEDSAVIVNNYINQWLQQQVVLAKAEKNVKNDFDKELQSYKNSLITYEYERQIVEQLLDTNVSQSQMEAYYSANGSNLKLGSSIVRMIFVKVPYNAPNVSAIQKRMSKSALGDKDLMEIQKLASAYASDFRFDTENWVSLYSFQSMMPADACSEQDLLQGKRTFTATDNEFAYIARVIEYKPVGALSPIEYESDNIKTIILNQRKIEIIKNMQRDLFQKALKNGDIVIHETK